MYKQIIPATGWLYVEHHKEQDAIAIYYLAAWALKEEDGHVIGLISVTGSQQFDDTNKMARLVTVPPNNVGCYKHINELSPLEKRALDNDGFLKNISASKEAVV